MHNRSLNYQFINSINAAFNGGGVDKHSIKHTGEHPATVYSYSERSNLIQTSCQLADYIKSNFQETKMVKDINPAQVQSFLNTKAQTCSQATLGQLYSRIGKLQDVINKVYHAHANFKGDVVVPVSLTTSTKQRDIAMSRQDFNAILGYATDTKSTSEAPLAIKFAGTFGLRVSETTNIQPRDIDLQKNVLHIHESKGGRSRDISINPEDKKWLSELIQGKTPNDRLVKIKEDSVNRWLTRAEEALKIREKYKEAKTGIHSVRKMVAQEIYDRYRKEEKSKKEAMDLTSQYLGHGKNRVDILKMYVLHIW